MVTNVGPQVQWISLVTAITHPPPRALSALHEPILSFVLRGAYSRVWISLLYVSMNCFLTCLRYYCLRCQARGIFPIDLGCLIFPMKM